MQSEFEKSVKEIMISTNRTVQRLNEIRNMEIHYFSFQEEELAIYLYVFHFPSVVEPRISSYVLVSKYIVTMWQKLSFSVDAFAVMGVINYVQFLGCVVKLFTRCSRGYGKVSLMRSSLSKHAPYFSEL